MIFIKIFLIGVLTVIWIILTETFDPAFVISGIILSALSLQVSQKFLPVKRVENVNFARLALYPFMLLKEIYKGGFYVIGIIFSGEKTELLEIDTELKNEALIAILAESITMTPGSVIIEKREDGNKMLVAWLRPKHAIALEDHPDPGKEIKGPLEKALLKAEKQAI